MFFHDSITSFLLLLLPRFLFVTPNNETQLRSSKVLVCLCSWNYSTFDIQENVQNISTTLSMEVRVNIIYFHSGWRTVWLIRSYISYISTYNSTQCLIWWFMISVFALNFGNVFFLFRSPLACYAVAVILKVICLLFHQMTTTFSMIIYYTS